MKAPTAILNEKGHQPANYWRAHAAVPLPEVYAYMQNFASIYLGITRQAL